MYKIADINIQRIHSDTDLVRNSEIADHKMEISDSQCALMSTPFIQKVCLADRGMSYGMSQRRFAESMKDMDKEIIELEGCLKTTIILHFVPWHKTKNEQQPACNDLPSSSIDEARLQNIVSDLKMKLQPTSVLTHFYMC